MNIDTIVVLDIISVGAFTYALWLSITIGTGILDRASNVLLSCSIGVYVFVGVSNILEHGNISSYLDRYEDYAEVLFVPFFLYFIYSMHARYELDKRRRAEQSLERSKERYKSILEDLPDLICRYKPDTTITFVNDAYARYFGRPEGELLGTSFLVLIPQESHAYVREKIASLNRNNPFITMEHGVITPDGQRRWQVWTDRALFDSSGMLTEIQSIGRDITEQKIAGEAQENSRRFLQTIMDGVSEPIIVVGDNYRIRMMNKAAREFSGSADKAEFCYEVSHGRKDVCDHTHICCPLDMVRKSGKQEIITHYHRRSDGAKRLIEIIASPFWGADGTFQGIIQLQRDITEHKKMENELIKIQKLESLGVLAGGLAHDFNNLLTAILGNINLARIMAGPDRKTADVLADAETAAIRAKDLTYQLLTFSKGGKPVLNIAGLGNVIKETAQLTLSGSNIDSEFIVPDDLWPVEADTGQMSQVFHNIVLNAREAMPEGGLVTISAENRIIGKNNALSLNQGRYIMISFEDRGRGIPDEVLQNIFDPYFTTKEMGPQKGMGLGLSICYSIVKNHHGLISVTSREGMGTTVYIWLPASPIQDLGEKEISGRMKETRDAIPVEGAVFREEPATYNGRRILVMDDEKMLRDVLTQMLHKLDFQVDAAVTGEEALALYRSALQTSATYDAVILDLTVKGGMGGAETFRQLQALDPDVKAIISSGYSKDPVIEQFRTHGFAGILLKPYNMNDLARMLEAVLSEHKG
jgi:PAS domain S-box-containing protein